jgi:hypothetical protein
MNEHGGACVCSQCVSDGYQYPIHHANCPCPVCQQRRLEEGAKAVLDRQCAFHGSIGDLITLGASIRESIDKLTQVIRSMPGHPDNPHAAAKVPHNEG